MEAREKPKPNFVFMATLTFVGMIRRLGDALWDVRALYEMAF